MRKFDSAAPDVVSFPQHEGGIDTMATENQKASKARFRKENERQYFFSVVKTTRPRMINYIDSLDNKQAYIRHLIAMDMKAKGIETDGLDGEMEETP